MDGDLCLPERAVAEKTHPLRTGATQPVRSSARKVATGRTSLTLVLPGKTERWLSAAVPSPETLNLSGEGYRVERGSAGDQ